MDDELAFHLDQLERELIADGLSASAAAEEAKRRFGPIEHHRRECIRIALQENTMGRTLRYTGLSLLILALVGVVVGLWANQRATHAALVAMREELRSAPRTAAPPDVAGPERESWTVTITGAAPRPGAYSVTAETRLRALLISAGVDLEQVESVQVWSGHSFERLTGAELADLGGRDIPLRSGNIIKVRAREDARPRN